ncbi:MAG: hypothetical protein ACQEQI_08785 [Bacillota bacterium]
MYKDFINLAELEKQINFNLSVHYGIIEYLSNYSTEEGWSMRGISGRDMFISDYFEYQKNKIKKLKRSLDNNKKLKKKVDDFLDECMNLFNAFLTDNEQITNKYLQKEFYFILGCPRTGGTFMLKEVSKAFNYSHDNYYMSLMHDGMPNMNYQINNGLNWRKPENYYYILFQLCQFLVYVNREVDSKYIAKKTEFEKYIQLVDHIFGDQAHYIVTVRHPAAVNASRMETGAAGKTCDDVKTEMKRSLYIWQTAYSELVRDGLPKGEVVPVLFGSQMDRFLDRFFDKFNSNYEQDRCKVTSRDYNYDICNGEMVLNTIERVRKLWELQGVEFPVPIQIL